MRKEDLLYLKKELVTKELSYTGLEVSEEELKIFSARQLKVLCDILKRNQATAEKRAPFLDLSATQILQKDSGKIVDFDFEGTGQIKEVDREYIMSGASRLLLEKYENGIDI